MNRAHLYGLTALLTAIGLGVFIYKAAVLGFPLLPQTETRVWTVQARFSVEAGRRPVKAVLQIPNGQPGFSILDENFVSRGYGLTLGEGEDDDAREARWAIRRAAGRHTLYYRAVIYADEDQGLTDMPPPPAPPVLVEPFQTAFDGLVAEIRQESADTVSFTGAGAGRLGRSARRTRPSSCSWGRAGRPPAGRSWPSSCSPPSACRRGWPTACRSRSAGGGPIPALARGLRRGPLAGVRSGHRRRGLAGGVPGLVARREAADQGAGGG